MQVTLGGNRVGSGRKMKAELHNYFRSTHNLSEKWASSMASGILYPALVKPAMRGDSFDIDVDADCRTIPTLTPLFGSFKMQIDVYQCPIRLYQALLHNNPTALGLKMSQVKLPKLQIKSTDIFEDAKMNESSLMKYLGLSGIGDPVLHAGDAIRRVNALPALMYYDIFKTYYANKQEDKAYIIGTKTEEQTFNNQNFEVYINGSWFKGSTETDYAAAPNKEYKIRIYTNDTKTWINELEDDALLCLGVSDHPEMLSFTWREIVDPETSSIDYSITGREQLNEYLEIHLTLYNNQSYEIFNLRSITSTAYTTNKLQVLPFDLSNIDDMRYDILSHHQLGTSFVIGDGESQEGHYLPYSQLYALDTNDATCNKYPMNGLALKTYQNDIFNNWLRAEWIEGENSISALSSVSVSDGKFSMDALSFAEKIYNMLNRIAMAGATYEDWQDAVYETVKRRQIESPIFVGGMSQEVSFDEIVQTAPGDGNIDGTGTLGTMGGRGRVVGNKKGGKIHIKCDEACFIIAIISLTPRVFQTQGNEFYMTELDSMDDLHKPAMDGIGFQDLLAERMAWWGTTIAGDTIVNRQKIGKLPAWIEYMTSVDKAYGDFALEYGKQSMTLNRNYERGEHGGIKDATTYIDPSKFNYAFAYSDLDAQNFWVQINWSIKARRLMSARLIPNV